MAASSTSPIAGPVVPGKARTLRGTAREINSVSGEMDQAKTLGLGDDAQEVSVGILEPGGFVVAHHVHVASEVDPDRLDAELENGRHAL